VKQIVLILLFLFVSAQTFAQQSESALRKEYEKEKNGPHGECEVKWRRLQPGLDYRTITCLGDEDDLDLHVVRVNLDNWNLDTSFGVRNTARSVARSKDAPFAVNANFFDKSRQPIGVVVQSGELVRSPNNKSTWQSIFLVKRDGTARIVMPSSWPAHEDEAWMAVQAGPRLVIDGHTNQGLKNNYAAERVGVCIKKSGDVLFFANPTGRKLHIKEIARVARRGESDGGLACRNAMLFDGGHSVNFFADGEDKSVTIEGDPVPVFVYITSKESDQAK
jgi:uncharacterized protein YigE (DUF2233 family)